MPPSSQISASEHRFVQDSINSNLRLDGRVNNAYRHVKIETGFLPNFHGSARSEALCVTVHAELADRTQIRMEQYPTLVPFLNQMIVVDSSSGPFWNLTLQATSTDGYVNDDHVFAVAQQALATMILPNIELTDDGKIVLLDETPQSLGLGQYRLVTLYDGVLVDPTFLESQVCSGRLHVLMDGSSVKSLKIYGRIKPRDLPKILDKAVTLQQHYNAIAAQRH